MNDMDKSLQELHEMLKSAEGSLEKPPNHVMIVQEEPKFKKSSKTVKAKESNENTSDKPKSQCENLAGESPCFYCKGKGHRKHNCEKYLAEKGNGSVTSDPGITIIVIEN